MEIVRLNFIKEPRGRLYRGLLDFALGYCETALLVVRKTISLEAGGQAALSRLEPFLKRKAESLEWPGTSVSDLKWGAWVFEYSFTFESAEILKQAASGLYRWLQPKLPEDLCLLRADGQPWLVSITHERDGYLDLTPDEKVHLFEMFPRLKSLVRAGPSPPPLRAASHWRQRRYSRRTSWGAGRSPVHIFRG